MVEYIQGIFLPRKYFITSGCATSSISPLNAFDTALIKAGIAQCNLVGVSSILPQDAEQIDYTYISPGTITFGVLARMDGDSGETIGAGIGWASGSTSDGIRYGIVAEAHGYKDKTAIEQELQWKLEEMAKLRSMDISSIKTKVESFEVTRSKYGSTIVTLIYVPWDLNEIEQQREPLNDLSALHIKSNMKAIA